MVVFLVILALANLALTDMEDWEDPSLAGPNMGLRILKRYDNGNFEILKKMDGGSEKVHGYLKRILKPSNEDDQGYLRRVLRQSDIVEGAHKTKRTQNRNNLNHISKSEFLGLHHFTSY